MKREGKFSILNSQFSIRRQCRRGFTLIEMLVVIVIIVILMGVVFRLSRGAMAKSDYAKEERLVTLVRTLIEEFHAEYNIYPPVPVYKTHDDANFKSDTEGPDDPKQPINFRGAFPDGSNGGRGSSDELHAYPGTYSYAKIATKKKNNEVKYDECYFVFGLMGFFVDRSFYGRQVKEMLGSHGEEDVKAQWGRYNESFDSIQKDRAFAHRVAPIVAELMGLDPDVVEFRSDDDKNKKAPLHVKYDKFNNDYSMGFTTDIHGQWAYGVTVVYRDGKRYNYYDEGLVYISKPPYTTYLLFSTGPDHDYDRDHPEDRTRPKNKDNIYGNLGDK